jgi:hypothetical protein
VNPFPDGTDEWRAWEDQTVSEGAALLEELHETFGKYVIFPSPEAHDAVVAYVAATHAAQAWEHATRLAILSPEKRCGKSRLLDVIEATCYAPLITVNISPAALVRSIGNDPPTLLLDEADTVFGKKAADNNEDLRGILNAGHQRNRPYIRWDATIRAPEKCATFSMAVLAGIGDLPDTIMDRSVIVRMRRRTGGETVSPFRSRRDGPPLKALRNRLSGWVRGQQANLEGTYPDMPVEDRAADTWEPLVAIADLAGGEWPSRIRNACKRMTDDATADDAESSLGLRLLADLRTVFGDATALYTKTLLVRLVDLEDAPWGDLFGRQITSHDLSKRLKPYGVAPTDVREPNDSSRKGYRRDTLYEAWSRYLPCDTRDKGDKQPSSQVNPDADGVADSPDASATPLPVADVTATPRQAASHLTCEDTPVADVAATCLGCGEPLDTYLPDQTMHPWCQEGTTP